METILFIMDILLYMLIFLAGALVLMLIFLAGALVWITIIEIFQVEDRIKRIKN